MEEFDSGWDEPPSSLDSEIMNNYDIGEATMNGYEQSELYEQVLQMRDDPAMSFHAPSVADNTSLTNKDVGSVDYTTLSSEIFFATRLLHDETLDSTTFTASLEEPESSPYNENQNINDYLGSPLEHGDTQLEDSVGGLSQRESLDRDFLYSSFEHLSSERPDLINDEETSNKSWAESLPNSYILPRPTPNSGKLTVDKKSRLEPRKRKMMKIVRKNFKMKNENQKKHLFKSVPETKLFLKNNTQDILIKPNSISPTSVMTSVGSIHKEEVNTGTEDEFLIPSTSGIANMCQRKDGRKVPSYLKMYRLKDDKYPDIFACKNCYGIFTTLDSAMFHPCLKKRRGRRPKILEDCLVPL